MQTTYISYGSLVGGSDTRVGAAVSWGTFKIIFLALSLQRVVLLKGAKMLSKDILGYRTSANQLTHLYRKDRSTIDNWIKQGRLSGPGGQIALWRVVRWREQQLAEEIDRKVVTETLNQEQLGRLLDVSRQTLFTWGRREGLPRNKDGSYNLADVCAWLPGYYRKLYGRRFKKTFKALQSAFVRITAWTEKESEV